jgi:hypothetical protein
MNVKAVCPSCGAENFAEPHIARKGIRCHACGIGFVPGKVDVPEEGAKRTEAGGAECARLRFRARELNGAALIWTGLAVVIVFFNFVGSIATDEKSSTGYLWAGSLFSLAVVLFFFAQLFHIRAALENPARRS